MKRFGLLSCIIGLFLGYTSTIYAETIPNPLCTMTAPTSCFSVVNIASGSGEQFKKEAIRPEHCPTLGIRGLKDNSFAFNTLFKKFDITDSNSINKIKILQLHLNSNTTCGGRRCAPIGATITDPSQKNNLSVYCSMEHFSDGKYGICTQEAVRRYLAWYKVNNCNVAPTLTITAPLQTVIGEKINAKIAASGGEIYDWRDEDAFILNSVNENPVLENITLLSSNNNISFTPPNSAVVGDNPLIFSNTGTTTLSATGTVKQKPTLTSTSNEAKITITSSPNLSKPDNELGCNQLLPKYLVGASCNTELKGDARDITYWIQKFSGQITTFIAALAVLLIAWNAFGLVMASGDSDKIANGKKALMWVGIGLLLTIFAYVIVKTALSLTFLQ